MSTIKDDNDLPVCAYCGDASAALQRREDCLRRAAKYRGRPCCVPCRESFDSGERPKPSRPPRASGYARNGRTDRQRMPEDSAFGWDDTIRAIEDACSD